MDNETYLLPDEAVNAGFADMVVDIKPKSYQMTSNIKKEINMSNTLNILNKVIGMVNKSEFINQLYSDLAGTQIEIFQKDPSTYMVGDRTSKEDGQVLLSDGAKLNIVAYKIESIDRGTETPDVAVDAVAKEVVADEHKVEAAFNEGEAPKEAVVAPAPAVQYAEPKAAVEGEPVVEPAPVVEPVQVIEPVQVMDPVQVDEPAVEPAVAPDAPVEEAMEPIVEAVIEDIIEDEPKVEADPAVEPAKEDDADEPKAEVEEGQEPFQVTEEHMQAMHAEMAGMQERIAKLEAICMGYDARFLSMSKFEDIATEAIDTLATNAVSNFKPDAVAPKATKFEPKGSIFNQLKKKRNLN